MIGCKTKKSYEVPSCSYCKNDLFLERVYHKGHLFHISSANGLADENIDYSSILPEKDRLDYERLIILDYECLLCLKCHRCYEAKRDEEGRLVKGNRYF